MRFLLSDHSKVVFQSTGPIFCLKPRANSIPLFVTLPAFTYSLEYPVVVEISGLKS